MSAEMENTLSNLVCESDSHATHVSGLALINSTIADHSQERPHEDTVLCSMCHEREWPEDAVLFNMPEDV